MLRFTLTLCFLLALYGCGDASKAPPAAGTGAPREVPESVPTAKAESTAKDDSAMTGEAAEMAENTKDAKSEEADDDAPATGETATAKAKNSDDDADDEKEQGTSVDAAFAAAQKAAQKGDLKGAMAALEKGLETNPDDVNILFNLVKLNLAVAMEDPAKPDYPLFIKAAAHVRHLIKAKPEITEDSEFGKFAGMVYYKEAGAYSADNKTDEAMTALQAAIDSGFSDFDELEKDPAFEAVRALPTFPEFLAKARVAFIDNLFAKTKPFDFDFELTDIEGNAIAKADFKGKVLIVDVWGTWCPPCKAEIPHFVELVKQYKEKGLEIVGLNSEGGDDDDEALKTVQEFYKEHDMNYRCALIKSGAKEEFLKTIPDLEGFPTTLFFDRTGKLRLRVVGLQDYEKLETFVKRLLEEKSDEAGG
jgi:thiol-disulfide isomerase/thioredoxin